MMVADEDNRGSKPGEVRKRRSPRAGKDLGGPRVLRDVALVTLSHQSPLPSPSPPPLSRPTTA